MLTIIKQSILDFGEVLKNAALPVIALFVCFVVNTYFFLPDLSLLQVGINIPMLIKLNIFLIFYIFAYILTLLIVGYVLIDHKKNGFFNYFKSRFVKLFTDLTRSYNQILLLGLLLILPGFYRYLRLIFVPFISMEFESDSGAKAVDALKESSRLTKSVKLCVILLIVYLVFVPLDFIITIIPNDSLINTFLISLLSLSPLYYHCLVLSIYKKYKRGV